MELLGESVPRLVLRRADGWWDVVPQSTAIRAPQVLLWLTASKVGAEEAPCCSWEWHCCIGCDRSRRARLPA